MQIVDHIGVPVRFRAVLDRMGVVRRKFGMKVPESFRIDLGPSPQTEHQPCCGDHRQHEESRTHAEPYSSLSRNRICNQPAYMAERKLRGNQRLPVRFVCGSAQQTDAGVALRE